MKYCSKCGKELFDEAVICPGCGCPTTPNRQYADAPSFGFALLGFFIPILGLILYLVWKDSQPLKAKSVGKGALIRVIVSSVMYVLWFVVITILTFNMVL